MKVWEKTTQSSRMGRTRRIADIEGDRDGNNVSRQAKHTRGLVAAATAAISQDRRREKENMADFIAKKREMFLVQMSLDTKREEIRKLEQKAHMKEEALKKSELMLEEVRRSCQRACGWQTMNVVCPRFVVAAGCHPFRRVLERERQEGPRGHQKRGARGEAEDR